MAFLCAAPCHAAATQRVFYVTACGTDTNDDTDSIQGTLNAAVAAFNTADSSNRSGVAVVFPAGTYKISQRLTMNATAFPTDGGGIMIRGEGRAGTSIQSSSTAGALLVTVNVDAGDAISGEFVYVQIQDIQFQASVQAAGTAIEVQPYMSNGLPLVEDNFRIAPVLRNVRIARTSSNNAFQYGFKGSHLKVPTMDDLIIMGNSTYTEAGIAIDTTYGHKIKDCTIDGAKVGVSHYMGGEVNFFKRMAITNVKTGIKVENVAYHIFMSKCGGALLHSNIAASDCGVSLTYKAFVHISDNTFTALSGCGTYSDVKLSDCSQCCVTGNTFSANNTTGTGVSLINRGNSYSECDDNTISDNIFSSSGTGISVGSGVNRSMIYNNTLTSPLVDNGGSTRFVVGTRDPFVSPAAGKDSETFTWGENMGDVFNVQATDYGAVGDGITNDTAAIQKAATALATHLNNGPLRKGVLYFPAGSYMVNGTITMSVSNGAKLTIRGDGMQTSVIEASGGSGLFQINLTAPATRVDIHNLSIVAANGKSSGNGVYVAQSASPSASTARNFYMHNVLLEKKTSNDCFTNSLNFQNLARPFIENTEIRMYKSDEDRAAGTTGVLMTGVWGFECEDLGVSGGLETGMNITSRGGDVFFRNGGVAGSALGVKIDAGGGRVAVEASHINAKANLNITHASNASWVSTQTLSNNNSELEEGQTALLIEDCQNVTIRNIAFDKSWPLFYNPASSAITLNGTTNTSVKINGNLFLMPGKTYVNTTSCSTTTTLSNNFFGRTDVDEIDGAGSLTRFYHLNGNVGETYLLKNKATGNYLSVSPDLTTVTCNSTNVEDATQWKVAFDRATERYTLESKLAAPARLMRTGTALGCNGTDAAQARRWLIVNRQNGNYTFGGGIDSFVQSAGTGVAETGNNPIDDSELWQFIQAEDLILGMEKVTVNATQTTSQTWHHVSLAKPFPQPPVLFVGGATAADGTPLTMRVRNVLPDSFEFQFDEWDTSDGVHPDEEVSFIAVSKGSYKVERGGTRSLEAGTMSAVNTTWQTKTFNVPFSTIPCVFAQCTTTNNAGAVCARIRNVSTTGFQVKIQGGKGGGSLQDENVDFIAIDPGKNQYFRVGRGTGVTSTWTPQILSSGDEAKEWHEPGIVCSVQSCNEDQPCALRYKNLKRVGTELKVDLMVDEDASDGHAAEDVGWMLFGNLP